MKVLQGIKLRVIIKGAASSTNTTFEEQQYFFHPDHLGSSNYLTDVLGEAYQHVEFLPFGETFLEERNTQSERNPYLYNGKEKDMLTGLYYYGARYYDPNKSIFLGVDPLAEKYPNISPFAYCANNPIIYVDPDGRDWFKYQAQGQSEAMWQWHKGNSVTYTDVDGNSVTSNDGYSNLVKFNVSGTNSEGAQYGTIEIWNQNKLELTSDYVFSGNDNYSSTPAADKGTYFMRLDIRDPNGPQQMNSDESNPQVAWGIQKIPQPTLIPTRNNPNSSWDINASYGNGRIRLIPSKEVKQNNLKMYDYADRGLYLHGKHDSHNWTHGCVCDKAEKIFNYYWNGAGKNHRQKTPFEIIK